MDKVGCVTMLELAEIAVKLELVDAMALDAAPHPAVTTTTISCEATGAITATA